MMNLHRLISKAPNYVKRFGLVDGLRLLIQIERKLPTKSKSIKRYNLPGHLGPISLRETRSDHSIFWQYLVMCQYDLFRFQQRKRRMDAYQESTKKGTTPLIIDCGGNIGLATVWLAMSFPHTTIYTVDPDMDKFNTLLDTTSCFTDRVVAIFWSVWNDNSELQIVNLNSGSAAFHIGSKIGQSQDSIRAYTINDVCKLAGVQSPFIVKVDVWGSQASLFKNNTDYVYNTHLIMLELDDWLMPWRGTSRPFFSCISLYPFDYLISGETIFCFRDFNGAS